MCSKPPQNDEKPEDKDTDKDTDKDKNAEERIGPFPVWPDEPGGVISGYPDDIIERIRQQREELGDRDLDEVDDDDLYDDEDEEDGPPRVSDR